MSEQHGSIAEEAVRLFEALQHRFLRGAASASAPRAADVWSEATRESATGSAECRLCPVCRLIAVARTSGPEMVEHLAEAGEALLAAVREARAAYERARTGPAASDRDVPPDVEHIDIG